MRRHVYPGFGVVEEHMGGLVGRSPSTVAQELAHVHLGGDPAVFDEPRARWAQQHLTHLARNLSELDRPAELVAQSRGKSWWH